MKNAVILLALSATALLAWKLRQEQEKSRLYRQALGMSCETLDSTIATGQALLKENASLNMQLEAQGRALLKSKRHEFTLGQDAEYHKRHAYEWSCVAKKAEADLAQLRHETRLAKSETN